ncbi:MAG: response regulator transcription factor [Lachnospiraceae bacterium]|nr:response regulator transcription factor [Lachnospiraceae bacterium]
MRVLLAEDTKDLNQVETAVLQREGFEVVSCLDGDTAFEAARNEKFDIVILDIMMPGKSGLEILKDMRDRNDDTPVMLLTAKGEIDDRVKGLDCGANDYMVKPFSIKEFLARVRVIERTMGAGKERVISYGDLKLSTEDYSITSENSVGLSSKEFLLLKLLMKNTDRALSTKYIIEHVWDDEESANEDTVWLYIAYLKSKLECISSSVSISGDKGGEFRLCEE